MSINSLNLARSSDLSDPFHKAIYRFLEMLPGMFSWLTLLLGFVFSWYFPIAVAVFIIAFDFYWLCRVLYLAIHQVSSYQKMKENIAVDWLAKLEKENKNEWRNIYHLIILPFAFEDREVMNSTLDSLTNTRYPLDKIIILLALEDLPQAREAALAAQAKYRDKFCALWSTIHPKDIPGEIKGKGANVNYAVKQITKELLPALNIPSQNIVASLFDIDTKPYPQYFSCLTWHYLNSPDRLRKSYQPIPVYNNNIWQAPFVSRIIATSSTFWEMMQQERPEQLETFSSHSMPLKTLVEIGYPWNVVSDDSRIFWRAYFAYGGAYKVVPLYYPVSMDAVLAKSTFRTMINQYKQQRRWSGGVENLPYVFYNYLFNPNSKKISFNEKIFHVAIMLEGFWSWATCSLLTFGLAWLPLWLGGQIFNTMLLSYNLPRLTSSIMTAAMVGMIVSAIISLLLLPPRPKNYGRVRSLYMVLQWMLLPITLILFGSLPAIESQTRLMINKPLGFCVTEKTHK